MSLKRDLETAFLRRASRNSKLIVGDPFLYIQACAAFMEGEQCWKREGDQVKAMIDVEGICQSLVTQEGNRNSDEESQETILAV